MESDEFHVGFDEGSGQTYQMDPLRAFVLNALTENPLFFSTLLEELASIPALTGNAHIPEVLRNVLHEFQAHGLVEVAPR